jgi:PAS domain S-box-containing protein
MIDNQKVSGNNTISSQSFIEDRDEKQSITFPRISSGVTIAIIYILVGSGWILFSDLILSGSVNKYAITQWQTYKGWFFIIITGVLLYLLIKRSERKLLEKSRELIESEQKFRLAVDNFTDAFVIYDSDKRFLYANDARLKVGGLSLEDLIGKTNEEIFPPSVTQSYLHLLDRAIQTKSIQIEECTTSVNGKTYDLIVQYIPVLNKDGSIKNILGITHDITDRKKYEEEILAHSDALTQSKNELKQLTGYLNNARENERASIARDIHDHLGQILTGLKMDISMLRKKFPENLEIHEKISLLNVELDEAIKITRKIIEELRPPALDDLGLNAALESYVEEFEHRTGIKCTLNSIPILENVKNKKATTIFRVVQEALTNVIRHSKASVVKINFNFKDNDRLNLSIEDNGSGFELETGKKKFGIIGMRERIELINGTFNVESSPGNGTKIFVRIPLNH